MNGSEMQRHGGNRSADDDPLRKPVTEIGGAANAGNTRIDSDAARNEVNPASLEDTCPLPPGQHPYDPVKKDLDPVGFALYRVQTFLIWIDEHCATFETNRHSDPELAESELSNLRDSIMQGMIYLQRLSELILAGYTIDPHKRLPDSLNRGWFSSYAKRLSAIQPASQEKRTEEPAGG